MKQEIEKEKTTHRKLIEFFSDTALSTKGFRPMITERDAIRLKKVMDLKIFNESRMQQMMLYFLADKNFKNLGPSIATMLSATILNAIRNKAINRATFYKELDEYTSRYIHKTVLPKDKKVDIEENTGAVSMADLLKDLMGKVNNTK